MTETLIRLLSCGNYCAIYYCYKRKGDMFSLYRQHPVVARGMTAPWGPAEQAASSTWCSCLNALDQTCDLPIGGSKDFLFFFQSSRPTLLCRTDTGLDPNVGLQHRFNISMFCKGQYNLQRRKFILCKEHKWKNGKTMQRCQIEKQITKVTQSRLEWTLMIRHGLIDVANVWLYQC